MLRTLLWFVASHWIVSVVAVAYVVSAYLYAGYLLTDTSRPVNFLKATRYHKRRFALALVLSLCGLMLLDLMVGFPLRTIRRKQRCRQDQKRLEKLAEESRKLREDWVPPVIYWNEYKNVIVMVNEQGMQEADVLHKKNVRDGLLKEGSLVKPVAAGVYARKGSKLSERNTSGSYSGFDELVKFCSLIKREDLFVPHLDRFFEGDNAIRRLGSSWIEQLAYVYGREMTILPEWLPERYREITGMEKAMAV